MLFTNFTKFSLKDLLLQKLDNNGGVFPIETINQLNSNK